MAETHSNNYYNKDLEQFGRKLRNNSTLFEVIFWDKLLKRKQLRGYQFLRQRPIENYIVDFFGKDLKLIIEIDGKIHQFKKGRDKKREEVLKNLGYSIIRFQNNEILNNRFNVQKTLEYFIDDYELKNGIKK